MAIPPEAIFSRALTAPITMGVVNVTPDSFSDGGGFYSAAGIDHAAAVDQAMQMAQQGAKIVDVGGEASSFHRPGIQPVDPDEQLRRILPVVLEITKRRGMIPNSTSPLISVDTRNSRVAQAALEAGANMINDISAGMDDPYMLPLAARFCCPVILMHRRAETFGSPPPVYHDVCAEVFGYLELRAKAALALGIERHRIFLDPGLGFGKSPADNWKLLSHIGTLVQLGFPVALGASRKRFLAELLPKSQRDAGPDGWLARDMITSQITALAARMGVIIHRVHHVPLAEQALEIYHRMS